MAKVKTEQRQKYNKIRNYTEKSITCHGGRNKYSGNNSNNREKRRRRRRRIRMIERKTRKKREKKLEAIVIEDE